MQSCLKTTIRFCKKFISGSEFEKNKKECLAAIRVAGFIKQSDLQKNPPFSKFKPKDLEEIMKALFQSGLIDCQIMKSGKGRPAMTYFAIKQKKDVDRDDELCNNAKHEDAETAQTLETQETQ